MHKRSLSLKIHSTKFLQQSFFNNPPTYPPTTTLRTPPNRDVPQLSLPLPSSHAPPASASPNRAIISLCRVLSTQRSRSGHPRAPRTILSSPSSTSSPRRRRRCRSPARSRSPAKTAAHPRHTSSLGIACTITGSQEGSAGEGVRALTRRATAVAQWVGVGSRGVVCAQW